ncbi:hypothetical protein [Fischerella sp. PCC 9605]|uniref:hypothetical protein n=1 Tax=Fischerella sp. PCC 9605 TaxID=1173024 RepID=UPI00047C62F8|nr:hypothetical protein [Fischerella sp. PCC 9605]
MATNFQPFESQFNKALAKKATEAIGSLGNITITPINIGGAGNFNWFWEQQDNFNLNTYNYLSQVVNPVVNGALVLGDPASFINDYVTAIQDISFSLSSDDQNKLNQADTNAAVLINAVVSVYEQTYGPITSDEMKSASDDSGLDIQTKLDYVVNYKAGYLWSCAKAEKKRVLNLVEMESASNLTQLLSCAPASAQTIIGVIANYLNAISAVIPLKDAISNANHTLFALKANATTPTTSNGGMTTIADDGSKDIRVGFIINQDESSIKNALNNQNNKVVLTMSAKRVNETTVNVNVDNQGGVAVPLDFLELVASGSSKFNLYSFKGAGETVSVELTFTGVNLVTMSPIAYEIDTNSGWYDPQPIRDAVANGNKDVTGYKFSVQPSFDFSQGGNFGLLNALAIANYPTVKITYTAGNFSDFQESFQQESHWDIRLFGLFKIGSFSESLYQSSRVTKGESGSFSVTFTPDKQVLTVPPLDQMAYVIGGQATHPGVPTR